MSVPNFLHPVAERLAPTLKTSKFSETGVLTPEEFVAAGDFLVYKCPTWSWQSGEEGKCRSHLPPDKQFLLTRNVPCLRRANTLEAAADEHDAEGEDAGWTITHTSLAGPDDADIPDIGDAACGVGGGDGDGGGAAARPRASSSSASSSSGSASSSDVPDIAEFEGDNLVDADDADDDPAALDPVSAHTDAQFVATRTYDVSVTYDKYYQTPRVWLFGYDEARRPLSPDQIFEDVSTEHANKTVTIETHPHLSVSHASIHPCKHAPVMHKLIAQLADVGVEVRVDQYMLLFLKFISSVVPTIEYDYTS